MVTLEQIFSYLDEALAEATLQGNQLEITQIQQVTSFLTSADPRSRSVDELEAQLDDQIKQATRSRNAAALSDLQKIAGFLMRPAEAAPDREAARRLRILAAHAANAREEILRGRH
jgi:CRISPR/Cas system-associated protein Cas7 (RAMP superfamily)